MRTAGDFQGPFDFAEDGCKRRGCCNCGGNFLDMNPPGKLFLVSAGPGFVDLIPPLAERALKTSEFIVGYELYLTWIAPWIEGKEIRKLPVTQERERAALAIELAREGRSVSLVSSGDVGIYGMAALVLELMAEEDVFQLEVVPGISAASSCALATGAMLVSTVRSVDCRSTTGVPS